MDVNTSAHFSGNSEAFEALPSQAREAALAISVRNPEADPIIIRSHMLSVMSSALAPFYQLKLPGWTPIPISVNTLCVVDVGGSKSPVHKALVEPLEQYRDASHREFEEDFSVYEASLAQHRVKLELAKIEAKRARRSGASTEDSIDELAALTREKILPPKHRPRLAARLDLESLLVQLSGEGESIDFITDEGEKFLKSSLMRHVPELCTLIDGEALEHRRERKRPLFASRPSATFGLMVQPFAIAPFRPRLTRRDYVESQAVKLGFFARFLVHVAGSGGAVALSESVAAEGALEGFKVRLRDLYERQNARLRNRDAARADLHLAPDAEGYWKELVRVTSEMKRGVWRHLADFVSKMLSHVGKVAAVIHLWESDSHFVSLDALQRAWKLVLWHLEQYEALFAPLPLPPQHEADVSAIADFIRQNYWGVRAEHISTDDIGLLLALPNNRLRAALLRMTQRGMIFPCLGYPGFVNGTPLFSQSRQITYR